MGVATIELEEEEGTEDGNTEVVIEVVVVTSAEDESVKVRVLFLLLGDCMVMGIEEEADPFYLITEAITNM